MSRPSKTDQELGAMRDFWTEVRTLESAYTGAFSMFTTATTRPGVFVFRMVFTPLLGVEENGMDIDSLEFKYPNEEQSSLAAMLWRKSISLGRMVAEREHDKRDRRNMRG